MIVRVSQTRRTGPATSTTMFAVDITCVDTNFSINENGWNIERTEHIDEIKYPISIESDN